MSEAPKVVMYRFGHTVLYPDTCFGCGVKFRKGEAVWRIRNSATKEYERRCLHCETQRRRKGAL